MLEALRQLRDEALAEVRAAASAADVERLRAAYLGRKGRLNAVIRDLPGLAA
jgi:hypothetical protein